MADTLVIAQQVPLPASTSIFEFQLEQEQPTGVNESSLPPVDEGLGAWSFVCVLSATIPHYSSLTGKVVGSVFNRSPRAGFSEFIWCFSRCLSPRPSLLRSEKPDGSLTSDWPTVVRNHLLRRTVH
ncbi:hypothetical protein WG66_013113 [Moniliophthora roreri]|nr:hypothetical protein WG66_013113 [Moniliophthora roreri]